MGLSEVLTVCFRPSRPPATRVSDKVMIPQDEYPEINFVGLLIGPRCVCPALTLKPGGLLTRPGA